MSGGVRVWFNLQFGTIYSNHDYFYSMQLIFYYIRRKKNEFQCSSIGVGNWSFIKNIFLVFSSSSSIFFQKISSNRRTHYGNTGYGVSNSGNTQLESFLPKNQHTQRKLLNLENWYCGEVSKKAKIWLSQSKIIVIFLNFFNWRITI